MTCITPERYSLNPEQAEALMSDAPQTFVSAAAGSGKTRVLTLRVARALLDEGARLDSVVAITFTEAAAQEMTERISGLLAEHGRTDLVDRMADAPISTIHGLCRRLLVEHAHTAGIDPAAVQLAGVDAAALFDRSIDHALRYSDEDLLGLRARYGDEVIAALVRTARNKVQRRADRSIVFDPGDTPLAADDAAALGRVAADALARYERAKRRAGGLDFDDLEHMALALLQDPAVRRSVQARVHLMLVDEFQDTNAVQCAIIDAIAPQRALYVGDQWQSIYRFRGADVDVFRARSAAAGTHIRLATNYRSSQPILTCVNAMFSEALGDGYEPVAWPADAAADTPRPEFTLVERDDADPTIAEANLIAGRAADLVTSGTARPRDILILVSARTHMARYAGALRAAGLEVVEEAAGFFEDPAVEDTVALLTAAARPDDLASLLAVCRNPGFAMEWDELIECIDRGNASTDQHASAAQRLRLALSQSGQSSTAAGRVAAALRSVRAASQQMLPSDVVAVAVRESCADLFRLARHGDIQAVANLRKLTRLAAEITDAGATTLPELVDYLERLRTAETESPAAIADPSRDAVRIMTIHRAKGLEAPWVFVANVSNSGGGKTDQVLAGANGQLVFQPRTPDGSARIDTAAWEAARLADQEAGRAERLRLMYVAMTRAEEGLVVSGSVKRKKDGSPSVQGDLTWMVPLLDFGGDLPDPGKTSSVLGGTATLQVVAASSVTVAEPVEAPAPQVISIANQRYLPYAPPVSSSDAQEHFSWPPAPADDSVAARAARVRGTRLHAAIEQGIRAVSSGTGISAASADAAREALDPVDQRAVARLLAAPWLADLVARGAVPEVPYTAVTDAGPEAGRFDLLLREDTGWTIVDFKSSLPQRDDTAWAEHREQLDRYAAAASAAGATGVTVILAAVDDPARRIERELTPSQHA